MRIGIIGVGYVGLVSGVCFSDFGHTVTCIDKDRNKIEQLKDGVITIYEPGLEAMQKKNMASKRLFFEHKLDDFIQDFDVIFIAVGTPSRRGDGQANLDDLYSVAMTLKKFISPSQILVIKSTVPVGTNRKVSKLLNDTVEENIELVSNPEFLREGSAIEDFMRPDRVIVGLKSDRAKNIMMEAYSPLYLRDFPIMFTDPESAELIKYASNAFLATKVSFINDVAALCEQVGANIKEVSKGMGFDRRIGSKFLHAGPGYGGSCFPKDTRAFASTGREMGVKQGIIEAVIKANEDVKNRMIEKILGIFGDDVLDKVISFLGVTFKPNTDDMREAPSLTIIPALRDRGAIINIYDPQGRREGEQLLEKVNWFDTLEGSIKQSDLIVILTEWNEFRALDLKKISALMRTALMADLRNIYSESEVLKSGFEKYFSVGR